MYALRDLSIRTKLMLASVALTSLSIALVAVPSLLAVRQRLQADALEHVAQQAQASANEVGEWLARELASLEAFALGKMVQDAVERASVDRAGAAPELVAELRELAGLRRELAEVVLADARGQVIAATSPAIAAGEVVSDQAWWRTATAAGGAPYVGIASPDPASGRRSLTLAMPVRVHGRSRVAGALRVQSSLEPLRELLRGAAIGAGAAALRLGDGYAVRAWPVERSDAGLSPEPGRLGASARVRARMSPLRETVAALGWSVEVDVPSERALAPVRESTRLTWVAGAAALLIAGSLALWLSAAIVGPLRALKDAAHQLAAGHLDRRVPVAGRDELGALAGSFNTMADTVQDRLRAEHAMQAQLRKRQEAELASRANFEQQVRRYLDFARRVSAGDLEARVRVAGDDLLSQLGVGLDAMAASLQSMVDERARIDAELAAKSPAAIPIDDAGQPRSPRLSR